MNQISSHISNNSFSISVDSISLQSNDIIEEENMNSSNNKINESSSIEIEEINKADKHDKMNLLIKDSVDAININRNSVKDYCSLFQHYHEIAKKSFASTIEKIAKINEMYLSTLALKKLTDSKRISLERELAFCSQMKDELLIDEKAARSSLISIQNEVKNSENDFLEICQMEKNSQDYIQKIGGRSKLLKINHGKYFIIIFNILIRTYSGI